MKEAIINLINKWACPHDWVLEKEFKIQELGVTSCCKFIYRCKKCGKFKTIKV